jgi:23S rRNA (uracil1939-C5)-methyltransferase
MASLPAMPPPARHPRRPAPRSFAGRPEAELTIEALGSGGDGVATVDGARIHVPYAAPGDRVRARLPAPDDRTGKADFLELVAAGPNRAEPPCPHFGPCGGCRLQHVAEPAYRAWKRELVVRAFAHHGIETAVADAIVSPQRSRRRAVFAARRGGRRVFLGFNEERSTRIVDLATCFVVEPALFALLAPLRVVLAEILPDGGAADVAATLLDDGVDLVIAAEAPPRLADRERLAEFAAAQDLARLSWSVRGRAPEPIAHRREGVVRFGGIAAVPPPGGFLQATRPGEAALIRLVTAAAAGAGAIADLFCGVGTFALPLSESARSVRAVDGDRAAVGALNAAARRAGRGERVNAEVRDLFRDPITPGELAGFDAVVFDPPRVGAAAQAAAIAASAVPLVIAVSCNPGTLARDARTLIDGGYRIEGAPPVDQFLWSPHLEAVAVFRR